MKTCLSILIAVSFSCSWLGAPDLGTYVAVDAKRRVDETILAEVVPNPRIQAYDLSPKGDAIAVFVLSGDLVEAHTWVVLVRTADSKILRQVRFGTSRLYAQGYSPQIAFAADGSLLVVEDGQRVSILDAATLAGVRTLTPRVGERFTVPVGILTAAKSMKAAISFGTGEPVFNYMDKQRTRIEIVDLSTGQRVAGWEEDDIPFSISPDAAYLAISDHSTFGVLGVKILDTRSGKKVASLSGEYSDKRDSTEKPWARLIAKFISDDEVILTPDANSDQSGRKAGTNLELIQFKDARVTQEIDPTKYGPTGEVAVSCDRRTFVTVSRHIAPKYLTHHLRIPAASSPELLVFSKQQKFTLENRKELPPLLSLRARSKFEAADLRVSCDGSVISFADDYGVTILSKR